jgi:hypothetical protein
MQSQTSTRVRGRVIGGRGLYFRGLAYVGYDKSFVNKFVKMSSCPWSLVLAAALRGPSFERPVLKSCNL